MKFPSLKKLLGCGLIILILLIAAVFLISIEDDPVTDSQSSEPINTVQSSQQILSAHKKASAYLKERKISQGFNRHTQTIYLIEATDLNNIQPTLQEELIPFFDALQHAFELLHKVKTGKNILSSTNETETIKKCKATINDIAFSSYTKVTHILDEKNNVAGSIESDNSLIYKNNVIARMQVPPDAEYFKVYHAPSITALSDLVELLNANGLPVRIVKSFAEKNSRGRNELAMILEVKVPEKCDWQY